MTIRPVIFRGVAVLAILLFALSVSPQLHAQVNTNCGVERWVIKTLQDEDTSRIEWIPKPTSISEQLRTPSEKTRSETSRLMSEKQVYRLRALLLQYKLESDGDLHLVLQDPDSLGKTMVAEIPNPDCETAKSSVHAQQWRIAREWIAENLGKPKSRFQSVNPPRLVEVVGAGFFDSEHGQVGGAPNGRELHPVLSIEDISVSKRDIWNSFSGKLSYKLDTERQLVHVDATIEGSGISAIRIVTLAGAVVITVPVNGAPVFFGDVSLKELSTGSYYLQLLSGADMLAERFELTR